jgi:hypothetical protein
VETESRPTDEILDEITEPWPLLIEMRKLDMADRGAYLTRWVDLVATKPPLEQDSLIRAGRDIWGYRVETVRGILKERYSKKDGTQTTAALITDTVLAEMYYRPESDPPIGFLVYNRETGEVTTAPSVVVGKTTFYPSGAALVGRTILIPSGIEEYSTDWTLFSELRQHIERYLVLDDPAFRTLSTAYIMMTWVADKFDAVPYLRVIGDTGSGKSRYLQTIGSIIYRSAIVSGATTASPIFRIIERYRGSLVLDEMDFSGHSELWDEIALCAFESW